MSSTNTQSDVQSLVVIGNFDGVHRGHQSLLSTAESLAVKRNIIPRLLTFDPHPAVVLGRPAPAMLTRMSRKLELLKQVCPRMEVAVRPFTAEFAQQSPRDFAQTVLRDDLHARWVMVGENFRFGKARAGTVTTLAKLGEELGFDTERYPLAEDAEGAWSSTRIRKAIVAGDLEATTDMLGRPHMVSGVVEHGAARGRTIGFPTCNIGDIDEVLPPHGVYAVLVDRVLDSTVTALAKGVANLGVRPTVHATSRPTLEVNLFDLDEDLYGATLRVHFVKRLRAEKKFDGIDALIAQIAKDAAHARESLNGIAPPGDFGHGFA